MKRIELFKDFYVLVSEDGKTLIREDKNVLWKQFTYNQRGDLAVNVIVKKLRRAFLVSRVVAQAFLGEPTHPKMQVNHKNGNFLDNSIQNLEWVTPSENMKHAYRTGLRKRMQGESHPMTNLTEEDVINIRLLRKQGATVKYIASQFRIKRSSIYNILSGKRWTHLG
jgi:hypothetical protein